MQQGQRGEAYPGLHMTASPAYLESRTIHPEFGLPHVDPTYAHEVAQGRVIEQELRLPRKIPCLLTCAQMQSRGTSPVTGPLPHDNYGPISWPLQVTRHDLIQVRQVT